MIYKPQLSSYICYLTRNNDAIMGQTQDQTLVTKIGPNFNT